jgi:DNA-binding transcriptional LysR family regulator
VQSTWSKNEKSAVLHLQSYLATGSEDEYRQFMANIGGTLGNTNLMVDAALAGIGIAWVPDYHVAEHLAAGRLIHLLPEWSPSIPGACLYYPANRHPPTALRLFTQAVREWAGNVT